MVSCASEAMDQPLTRIQHATRKESCMVADGMLEASFAHTVRTSSSRAALLNCFNRVCSFIRDTMKTAHLTFVLHKQFQVWDCSDILHLTQGKCAPETNILTRIL